MGCSVARCCTGENERSSHVLFSRSDGKEHNILVPCPLTTRDGEVGATPEDFRREPPLVTAVLHACVNPVFLVRSALARPR